MKRLFAVISIMMVLGMILASCATPTPETIIETVEVPVIETVEVVTTVEVEVPVVVEATKAPRTRRPGAARDGSCQPATSARAVGRRGR